MQNLGRNTAILIILLIAAAAIIYPPEKRLRLGKDLAGGASLVYAVDVGPGETGVAGQVAEVVKERLDPNGVMEIQVIVQGNDRIEITMPLPKDDVKRARAEFDKALGALGGDALTIGDLEDIAAMEPAARTARIVQIAGDNDSRREALEAAVAAWDRRIEARARVREMQTTVDRLTTLIDAARAEGREDEDSGVSEWLGAIQIARQGVRAAADDAAVAEIAWEDLRGPAVAGTINTAEVRRALQLSNKPIPIRGAASNMLPSPREDALQEIYRTSPGSEEQLAPVLALWQAYEAKRRTLDDPADVIRMLKGAGVLTFRITVDPGTFPGEAEARAQLREGGPRAVRVERVRWFRINRITNWVQNYDEYQLVQTTEGAAEFFRARGYVVERFRGEFFMLAWDEPGLRLTRDDGEWKVARAFEGMDQFMRPAIDFEMDVLGGQRLGELTGANVNKRMAVLLDDEVYTAPNLISRISARGQISGNFNREELNYVIKVLNAGSLQAKLSPEPISSSVLAPTLGADNLRQGMRAGQLAFVFVAAFMLLYYFGYGLVAVLALGMNALLLVGAMAFNQAAFTLPGIAGIILTFGMAVDANVLIYERIREELNTGNDLRTSVRLGYQRALSAIVDGNITTLIVCVVLGFTGTQEIKGFALTLGIGTVTTLFAQLFGTRIIFTYLVDRFRVRRMNMLATLVPGIQKVLQPNIDWMRLRFISYAISFVLVGTGVFFIATEWTSLLGIDFRGGTAVTIVLSPDDDGKARTMTRAEVEQRLIGLRELAGASPEVVVINPGDDNVSSNTFRIRTVYSNPAPVQEIVTNAFEGLIDSQPRLVFEGQDAATGRAAPVFPIVTPVLGDSVNIPTLRTAVTERYDGRAAIVLKNLSPAVSAQQIKDRLREMRSKPDFSDVASRTEDVVVVEGTPEAVRTAVVLVADPRISYHENRELWESFMREREWTLVRSALGEASTLASVESFSPSVAETFRNRAIAALLLATVLVVIYLYVRFGSLRYSAAAILTTLHDCVVAIGLVALAEFLFYKTPGLASSLMLLPFKIDLTLVAAILAILGYSLNDTIVIMDRIRENRGKLPYASRKCINDSINQTLSRTFITSGTTIIAIMMLYLFGGEGVREFAYIMLAGSIVGVFSSIAVAAPLVWVKGADPHEAKDRSTAAVGREPVTA
ncbi:MAG: protein translocase subunit SecD [Phycisphaeraceae bacterium]|nr:protein translocase subunit SecD [Phycisphaeraceae bacterium]